MNKQIVGVAGIGLIGGSFAMDLMAKGHGVVGYDIDADTCATAMELGVVQQASTDIAILDDCTVILIAVPVGNIRVVMTQLARLNAPNLKAILDSGSTKTAPLEWAAAELGPLNTCFIACHPIAGTEHNGVRGAMRGLFHNQQVVLCNLPVTNNEAVTLAKGLWQECGAVINILDAAEHDRMFAAVSHLPHLLAYLLVGSLGGRPNRDTLLGFASSGFADFTRIASSNAQMWRDVCLNNSTNIVRELDAFGTELDKLRTAVANGNGDMLRKYFDEARTLRDNWLSQRKIL